jgi:putative transposase
MPNRLHRYYGAGYLHFITTSCYQRRPLLNSPENRDLFLEVLERVRKRYHLIVVGYVVMPEHVHLLLSEPERGDPSMVMQAVKQGFARRFLRRFRSASAFRQGKIAGSAVVAADHVWQHRFYDFVVFTEKKRVEKLRYMHRNPVKRGLVLEPQQWPWSSFCDYAEGRHGPVLVSEPRKAELRVKEVA